MGNVVMTDKGSYTIKSREEMAVEKQTVALLMAKGLSSEEAIDIVNKANKAYDNTTSMGLRRVGGAYISKDDLKGMVLGD